MDSARWERIQELFHLVAGRPAPEQQAVLEAACADDPTLVGDVAALLEEDAHGSSLLDRDIAGAAARVLSDTDLRGGAFRDIGPYRIREVLGEGGMGIVYLAERTDLGTLAALKILRDAWLSPSRRERFATEQRTLAQLDHPAIARLFDAGTLADGTPWLVMEYVQGVPITEHCRTHAAPVRERLRLFREVCDAVQHAHRHLIVHRDLKPSNILVRGDGSVKLVDFGIAKQLDASRSPVHQTRTGLRLMTPAYAAPEQLRSGRVGVHTDVYSLGVVLYELLTGQLPFDLSNRTAAEAEAMLVEREPEKPSVADRRARAAGARPHPPSPTQAEWAELDVLCLTAMHRDPQRRYRTVEALMRDVDHLLGGRPLDARPDTLRYRTGKFVRRNRRPVVAAALVVAAAVVLTAFYTVQLTAARDAAVAEATRALRTQRFMLALLSGDDDAAGPADSLRVITLVDRGLQEARTLEGEPVVQAELFQTLGEIYHQLGKLDRADSVLGEALARRRSRLGPEHPEVATSLVSLGLLRSDQAEYEQAERLIRQALDIDRRRLPAGHPATLDAMEALGHILVERGAYTEAISALDEVARLRTSPETEPAELAGTLYELANVHFYAGNWVASDSLNRKVLPVYRRLYGERHPRVANVLVNLGAIRHERGEYAQAERLYRQALAIQSAWYGSEHPATAAGLTMLARPLIFQERADEAAALLRQALAIRERALGETHPMVASTLNELGTVALGRQRYDEAEAAYRRTAEIYRSAHGQDHYLLGIATSNLGSVSTAREAHAQAETLYREAIRIFSRTLPADHLNLGIARLKLGRALLRQGRFAEAERESRAGYEIVRGQTDPSVGWLANARKDLASIYDSLGQPAQAARFRAEMDSAAAARPDAR